MPLFYKLCSVGWKDKLSVQVKWNRMKISKLIYAVSRVKWKNTHSIEWRKRKNKLKIERDGYNMSEMKQGRVMVKSEIDSTVLASLGRRRKGIGYDSDLLFHVTSVCFMHTTDFTIQNSQYNITNRNQIGK